MYGCSGFIIAVGSREWHIINCISISIKVIPFNINYLESTANQWPCIMNENIRGYFTTRFNNQIRFLFMKSDMASTQYTVASVAQRRIKIDFWRIQ